MSNRNAKEKPRHAEERIFKYSSKNLLLEMSKLSGIKMRNTMEHKERVASLLLKKCWIK